MLKNHAPSAPWGVRTPDVSTTRILDQHYRAEFPHHATRVHATVVAVALKNFRERLIRCRREF